MSKLLLISNGWAENEPFIIRLLSKELAVSQLPGMQCKGASWFGSTWAWNGAVADLPTSRPLLSVTKDFPHQNLVMQTHNTQIAEVSLNSFSVDGTPPTANESIQHSNPICTTTWWLHGWTRHLPVIRERSDRMKSPHIPHALWNPAASVSHLV